MIGVGNRNRNRNRRPETGIAGEGKGMGGSGSRPLLLGLVVVMLLGFAVYFRLWTIDYSISSDETDLIRKEFDLAHREAMDESAEWRRQYDWQAERAANCEKELREVQEATKDDGSAGILTKMAASRKENSALLKQLDALKHELDVTKLRCKPE